MYECMYVYIHNSVSHIQTLFSILDAYLYMCTGEGSNFLLILLLLQKIKHSIIKTSSRIAAMTAKIPTKARYAVSDAIPRIVSSVGPLVVGV